MKRTPLRRVSARRLVEIDLYRYRRQRFLAAHPYCAVWIAEHGTSETALIARKGVIELDGRPVAAPLTTEIHHMNKRRSHDLLDESHWLAVSAEAHRRIEENKSWARVNGFLRDF